ncbi:MAG: response regulator transcription factor [Chloroflexi bacterium]|nr:response regulator transcription factor [Chloroflexota bacterium]
MAASTRDGAPSDCTRAVRTVLVDPPMTTMPEDPVEPTAILVVDDDPALVRMLRQLLIASGYQVWAAESGAAARALLAQHHPDLILLDLMLPDADGLVLTPAFKTLSPAPIIILSARSEQVDRVLGLKLGADDFVAKPFDPDELLARIAGVLRRGRPRPVPSAGPRDRIHIGQLTLARSGGPVTIGAAAVHLTPTEHRLLLALADHADQVVPRATLLELVWGDHDPSAGHVVDVYLARLRLKLAQARLRAPALVTVRGLGYKLVTQPALPGETNTGSSESTGSSSAGQATA